MKIIKLTAAVLALLMTIAVFGGCTKDKADADGATIADGEETTLAPDGDGEDNTNDDADDTTGVESDVENSDDNETESDGKTDPVVTDKTPSSDKDDKPAVDTDKDSGNDMPETEKPAEIVKDVVGTWSLTYDYGVATEIKNGLNVEFTWTITKDGKLTVKQTSVPTENDALAYCRDMIEKLYLVEMTEKEAEEFAIEQGYESADEFFDVLAEKTAEDMVRSFDESPAEYSGTYTFDGNILTVDGTLKLKLKAGNGKWIIESVSGDLEGILVHKGAEFIKK